MYENISYLLIKNRTNIIAFKWLKISVVKLLIFLYEKRLETLRGTVRNSTEIGAILYDKQIGCL